MKKCERKTLWLKHLIYNRLTMKVQSECNLPVFDRVWISMYCQFCSIINLSLYSSFQFIQVFILVSQYALVANQLSTVGNHFRIPHTHKRKHSFTEYF